VQATCIPQGVITRCALTSHLEDFLQANTGIPFSTLLEADESQIARYVDGLWSRPARRGSGHKSAKEKITYCAGYI